MRFRNTQIDIDIHKAIEAERHGFAESDNDVLRRLLGLPQISKNKSNVESILETAAETQPGAWSRDGVTLPNGTLLRMVYNGQVVQGQVVDGVWIVNGRPFTSPSGAAMENARTRSGKKTSLDGWIYWQVKRPEDKDYIPISTLRNKSAA